MIDIHIGEPKSQLHLVIANIYVIMILLQTIGEYCGCSHWRAKRIGNQPIIMANYSNTEASQ